MEVSLTLRNMTSVYLWRGDSVLLLFRQGSRVVNDVWTGSAGGHFEKEELNDPKACLLRELSEELSLTEEDLLSLELRYVTLRRAKGEIRQNYYFFAELKEGNYDLVSDEGKLQWFPFSEIEHLPMPFSAGFMIRHYLSVGRRNQKFYAGVADGERVVFTEMPDF